MTKDRDVPIIFYEDGAILSDLLEDGCEVITRNNIEVSHEELGTKSLSKKLVSNLPICKDALKNVDFITTITQVLEPCTIFVPLNYLGD